MYILIYNKYIVTDSISATKKEGHNSYAKGPYYPTSCITSISFNLTKTVDLRQKKDIFGIISESCSPL